jgi:sugar fermentation stimulation protein A
MIIPIKPAKLIKRYKRFLTDVILPNDIKTTIHCANTGAMKSCGQMGDTIWYSTSSNLKRKYPFSWEIIQDQDNNFICVNTLRANQLVEEALHQGIIKELNDFDKLKREVKYGAEHSRIDFMTCSNNSPDTYIEVKSVTFLEQSQGYFPDAITTRGQKHLRELIDMVNKGYRAVLLFAVLHSGINNVRAAQHIDPTYAKLINEADEAGVEIIAYKAQFNVTLNELSMRLVNKIDFIIQ